MSQKKVDAYKAEKAKRKETVESNKKKQKIRTMSARIAGLVIAALIVVALVFTGINAYKSHQESLPTYDITEYNVNDYSGLKNDDESESETPEESESAAENESAEESAAETEEPTTAAP